MFCLWGVRVMMFKGEGGVMAGGVLELVVVMRQVWMSDEIYCI